MKVPIIRKREPIVRKCKLLFRIFDTARDFTYTFCTFRSCDTIQPIVAHACGLNFAMVKTTEAAKGDGRDAYRK